ncbi:acyclic terpene utilization AtuA family protein [Brevibacterium sp. BRM-1]|uniref:acyclic terpene utilization AtuA family protein n=1 Tax=Brevibacterium sp. BRM-1 TaxID=2999062 RepID=UPI002280B3C6|nr:acyclic terpene utilization AtuA family protein [Brevibacterium sp. BRM-1]WAL40639.1 acyclic terpene utilization AtuA family protein [Brevibacterium sp. BRM-1]
MSAVQPQTAAAPGRARASAAQGPGAGAQPRTLRIGCASGFYGDRLAAFGELVDAGVDVVVGDYLAELTMLILARQKAKDPAAGFAKSFLAQVTGAMSRLAETGTRVVANAGGMNPAALAAAIAEAAAQAGIDLPVAFVDGDDLTTRAGELSLGEPLAANAYLGGFGIARALAEGAQVVVTGRVTDASLVTGPAAWFHGWERTDYDALAGAMAAGHVIECGMQATGGNFSFFTEIADLIRPGFPIAEVAADGSSIIAKPAHTSGAVTVETVLSQLLYEVAGARYPGPDATLRLDSIRLEAAGPDRVRICGVRGEAPPPDLKVSVNELGGFRQELTFFLTGLDIEAKAALVRAQFAAGLAAAGLPEPAELEWELSRTDRSDAATQEQATARLRLIARDRDPQAVGRAFANTCVEFALGSIPGFFMAAPPGEASVYGRFRAGSVPQDAPAHTVHAPDGSTAPIAPPPEFRPLAATPADTSHPAVEAPGSPVTAPAPVPAGPQAAGDAGTDPRDAPPTPRRAARRCRSARSSALAAATRAAARTSACGPARRTHGRCCAMS